MNSRRSFLKNVSLATAASVIPATTALAASASQPQQINDNRDQLIMDSSVPIVNTNSGPVRGYIRNTIHTFKGIPYGASTAGKHRFMPPQKPAPWTTPFNAVAYSYACLQYHGDDWARPLSHFVMNFDFGMMSENCLNLNVWTPSPDSAKRPVIVWIHGGGFSNGSSFEMLPYDGENFAQRGNAVFVSINHRLNALGFLNLSGSGEQAFSQSANVGMLDIVQALKWVRDNISNFGGDPQNVTICGHSGGGGKVNALLRMPSAKGLFHKAIIMSGSFSQYRSAEISAMVGDTVAKKLNISGKNLSALQEMPYEQLLKTCNETISELEKQHNRFGFESGFNWAPTADGEIITPNDSPELNSDVPLLIGYTRAELATAAYDPTLQADMSYNEAIQRLSKTLPEAKAEKPMAHYKKIYPGKSNEFLYSVVSSFMFATGAINQFESRNNTTTAPIYAYRFDWCPALLDGRLGAFHGLELAFTFHNTARWDSATGGGERASNLADKVSDCWINFMKTGNPNHRAIDLWPAYNENQSVMLFNDNCKVESAPDSKGLALLTA